MRPNHPILKNLLEAYLYDPRKVNKIINTNPDRVYMYRLSKFIFPYRVGIEIDATGISSSLRTGIHDYCMQKNHGLDNRDFREAEIIKLKNFILFSDDRHIDSKDCNEMRFSFRNDKGLVSFYELLKLLRKNKIPVAAEGGLHVHVDLGMNLQRAMQNKVGERVQKYFRYLRNNVAKNKAEDKAGNESVVYEARGKISICKNKNTIEYRMSDPTFNYTEIMKQVLCFQHINRAIRCDTEANINYMNTILDL